MEHKANVLPPPSGSSAIGQRAQIGAANLDHARRWSRQATDQGVPAGQTRLKQLTGWLGPDFAGVIAFDEAHSMGNAIAVKGARGERKPSQQAVTSLGDVLLRVVFAAAPLPAT